jgi:hypothetical protein
VPAGYIGFDVENALPRARAVGVHHGLDFH